MADGKDGEPPERWTCVAQQVVFQSQWFEVRRDKVIRPDGTRGEYHHVVVPGSVTVLALDEQQKVLVTRQWIYVHGAAQWRLPSGRIDDTDGDPEAAARRELVEETGITAERWTKIGVVHGADSFANHREHVFIAADLRLACQPSLESGEADLRVRWFPFDQVFDMVRTGEMPHAGSVFAVLMASAVGHLS